ncbi:hypothetical protein DFJ73DRAFT_779917 [Zopfochytrium polystomum]|nr:hypothetical protein DFJ73DRAFT_779917 [Zopfochytrium polystomum]
MDENFIIQPVANTNFTKNYASLGFGNQKEAVFTTVVRAAQINVKVTQPSNNGLLIPFSRGTRTPTTPPSTYSYVEVVYAGSNETIKNQLNKMGVGHSRNQGSVALSATPRIDLGYNAANPAVSRTPIPSTTVQKVRMARFVPHFPWSGVAPDVTLDANRLFGSTGDNGYNDVTFRCHPPSCS